MTGIVEGKRIGNTNMVPVEYAPKSCMTAPTEDCGNDIIYDIFMT